MSGLACGLALASSPAEGIRQALAAGQLEQAAKLVQQEKQRLPQDAELRFLEGVVQAQQGQTDKAIETFRKLVESHPGIVEAHNNLGVLYASKGRLEEARKALEAGMLTHGSYAALHRNLADVQSQLVKQTYAKALQVDSKARTAVAQLSLLGSMQAPRASSAASESLPAATVVASRQTASGTAPVTAAAPSAPVPAPVTPAVVASAAPAAPPPALPPRAVASTPPLPASATAAGPAAESPKAPKAASESAPAPAAKPAPSADTEAIRAAVMAWAKAWSRKDVDDYLQAYASSFVPPEGQSRSKWEAERKLRIVSKKSISVEVRQFKVTVEDKTATVQFQQIYSSDNFTGNSRKTLEMVRQGERWLIARERVN